MEHKDIIEATCPECRGPLTKIGLDHVHEYECLVGHKYSAQILLKAHSETQERALWAAVVALEEATTLVSAVNGEFSPEIAQNLAEQASVKHRQAEVIRKLLQQLEPFRTE
jgi:two-component system chemotaxis response regulator CheB